MVDPEGFQRVGVERLHHALRQCDEDHAVRIGRAVDGEAGRTGHFPGFDRFARVLVDAVERTSGVDNQLVVHEDRIADLAAAHAAAAGGRGAELDGPVERAVCRGDGRGRAGDGVVAVAARGHLAFYIGRSTEICPFGAQCGVQRCVFLRCLQGNGDVAENGVCFAAHGQLLHAVFRAERHLAALPDIARTGDRIEIGKALGEREDALLRPDALIAARFYDTDQRVLRRGLEADAGRHRLLDGDGIDRFRGLVVPVRQREAERLGAAAAVQRQRQLVYRPCGRGLILRERRPVHEIAHVFVAVFWQFSVRLKLQIQRACCRRDEHGIV